jgi:hypothetical protein
MSDYLVVQAMRDVYCSPEQDRQAIYRPAKISLYGGVFTEAPVMWRRYTLPLPGVRFHVYQLGSIYPENVGLKSPKQQGVWLNIAAICKERSLIVDIYSDKGIQLPRSCVWYMVTEDSDLILAVQDQPMIDFNLSEEPLFIRFYANAYFNSPRANSEEDIIDVRGMITRTDADVLTLQNAYNVAKTKAGETYAFINGRRVDAITLINAKAGDVIEYVQDGSIHTVRDFKVSDLMVFNSTLDSKHKYLLHPDSEILSNIDYQDDVDVFLYKDNGNGKFSGVFYHRHQEDAMRQVTHKDYSIPVAYVVGYQASNPDWDDAANLVVRLHIRRSGYSRPLVNEANRIKELYKLPPEDILPAMIGIDAVVPEWTAEHLENSAYTLIMRGEIRDVVPKLVTDAYGYNSLSQILANTPTFPKNIGQQIVAPLPYNLQSRSTVYEYNNNGAMTGWNLHALGDTYVGKRSDTHLIETITGFGTTALDEVYGMQNQSLDPTLDYRMYICGMVAGIPDNIWADVTDSAMYTIVGNILHWLVDPTLQYTMVRSNRDFLAYDFGIPVTNGVLRFSLTSEQRRFYVNTPAGQTPPANNTVMQVPMGELDLFLNGKALIEDIDYFVRFPEVVIISKRHLLPKEDASQIIHVRFCGHCLPTLKREKQADKGFIQHGVLSNNNRYDIRDDKVLHINVGGNVYERSELKFAETTSGVNVPGVADGTPYLIRDIVVPMRGTVYANTYALRGAAQITDQHVADYLSLKMPEPTFTQPLSIEQRYPVYSPFLSSIIEDLRTGYFKDTRMTESYNADVLRDMCKFYERLLAYEPTLDPQKVPDDFMVAHAYYRDVVVDLNVFQYRFLQRVVKLYLNDAISLSPYIRVIA